MSGLLSVRRVALGATPRAVGPGHAVPSTVGTAAIAPRDVREELLAEFAVRESAWNEERVALRAELEELKAKLDRLHADVQSMEAVAYARGEASGRAKGLAEAEDQQRERMERLGEGIGHALEAYDRTLSELAAVADEIALTAVERVLGDLTRKREHVLDAVALQMSRLREALPAALRVSQADFAETTELVDLAKRCAPGLQVHVDPTLPSGACRITLQMGEVDADLATQLSAIRRAVAGEDDERR